MVLCNVHKIDVKTGIEKDVEEDIVLPVSTPVKIQTFNDQVIESLNDPKVKAAIKTVAASV